MGQKLGLKNFIIDININSIKMIYTSISSKNEKPKLSNGL